MQNRPIHTLTEDFEYLGLTQDEMDQPAAGAPAPSDPKKMRMQKKVAAATAKAAAVKKQAMKAGYTEDEADEMISTLSEEDFDLLPDAEELELLDEFKVMKFFKGLLKAGKKKPSRAARMLKAKKSKQYRKGRGRSQAKRYKKSSRFKKLKKLYSKAKKMGKKAVKGARRSFASMLGSDIDHSGNDLSELGGIINALEHTEDSSQFAGHYAQIAQLSTAVAKEFRALDEGYVDINYPLDEAADYCDLIAAEAREFLGALEERAGTVSVADQALLKEHLAELRYEAMAMANYWDDTDILIALDEGRFPEVEEVTEESFDLLGGLMDEDDDLFDEDDDDEDPFDGVRGEVALMFGLRRR